MEKQKVKFGDLSVPLKIVVIFGWIAGVIFTLLFLIGFIEGLMLV